MLKWECGLVGRLNMMGFIHPSESNCIGGISVLFSVTRWSISVIQLTDWPNLLMALVFAPLASKKCDFFTSEDQISLSRPFYKINLIAVCLGLATEAHAAGDLDNKSVWTEYANRNI